MQCRRPFIALLLAPIALLPAACGSDSAGKPLSHKTASELRAGLDSVQQDIDAGDCQAATDSALELEQRAAGLPSRVDSDLRDAVERGVVRLGNLVRERCQAELGQEGATGPTAPPTAETGPTGTETTPDEDQQKDKSKEEKPSKPGKGEKKHENGGTTDLPGSAPPSDGGQGQTFGTNGNQESGGAAP
jgi:hypothetical protein